MSMNYFNPSRRTQFNPVYPDQPAADKIHTVFHSDLRVECCRITRKKLGRSVVHKNIQHDIGL